MAATGVAFRSTFLSRSLRTSTVRNLISPKGRFAVPNPNPRINVSSSSSHQTRIEGCVSRFLRRELSSQQPFHSAIASACLVSKLPSDVTASYEGRFANYISPI
ncbi:hypothetical protein AALP_AA1G085100 [Arabis alpina]|uniref:Uncharacterized protein n=1 Tax=Arabis alpina TaxID=50452 RepID=A0A087HLY7_ARAAL|nr:hypothetical protein AALP_AA1G085100 [Arabis alpina]